MYAYKNETAQHQRQRQDLKGRQREKNRLL